MYGGFQWLTSIGQENWSAAVRQPIPPRGKRLTGFSLATLTTARLSPTHDDLCVTNAPSNHVRWCNSCSLVQLMFAATPEGGDKLLGKPMDTV